MPSGLRYCMNAIGFEKSRMYGKESNFWRGLFLVHRSNFSEFKRGLLQLKVAIVEEEFLTLPIEKFPLGITGHAEVIEFAYNPAEISYEDLV